MARKPIEERLYVRNGILHVHGSAHGKAWNRTTGFTEAERDKAIEKATEIERLLLLDEKGHAALAVREREREAQQITLEQACAKLLEYGVTWGRSPDTLRFYKERCASFQRGLGAKTRLVLLTDDPRTLREYFEKRLAEAPSRKQKHTIQKDHRILKQVLERCQVLGLWKGNIKEFQLEQLRASKDYYTPGETWLDEIEYIDALVEETSSGRSLVRREKKNSEGREWVNRARVHVDRKLNIILYCNLGLRDSELQTIYPHHVLLRHSVVAINYPPDSTPTSAEITIGKTPTAKRVLGLNAVSVEAFKRRLRNADPDKPLFEPWKKADRDLKATWRRARRNIIQRRVDETKTLKGEPLEEKLREIRTLERTLPQSLCLNDLRRTFCSQMAKAGVPLQTCADIMGHADDAMVKRVYRRCAPALLQKAMEMMPAIALPPETQPTPTSDLNAGATTSQKRGKKVKREHETACETAASSEQNESKNTLQRPD